MLYLGWFFGHTDWVPKAQIRNSSGPVELNMRALTTPRAGSWGPTKPSDSSSFITLEATCCRPWVEDAGWDDQWWIARVTQPGSDFQPGVGIRLIMFFERFQPRRSVTNKFSIQLKKRLTLPVQSYKPWMTCFVWAVRISVFDTSIVGISKIYFDSTSWNRSSIIPKCILLHSICIFCTIKKKKNFAPKLSLQLFAPAHCTAQCAVWTVTYPSV